MMMDPPATSADQQQPQPSSSSSSLCCVRQDQSAADDPTHAQQSAAEQQQPHQPPVCAVCSEENAKMHYGVLACLGCKGFFRRALKKVNEYECLRNNNCTIDKQERNSCRSCRLQKCLDVGMDPSAVRPDRDFTGKQHLSRRISVSKSRKTHSSRSGERGQSSMDGEEGKTWNQRLPVEMRTMLMTLQNIEAKVVHGDTAKDAAEIYPLRINTLREIIEEPAKLRGRRTEMRYEPYRMAKNEEFSVVVYRRLIAAIDWVELLAERLGGLSTEDRIAMVKSCFGPLTLFKCSARTAVVTSNEDMLCLCNFAYVPREISKAYSDAYHLENGLVERLLNELVSPFRRIHLAEEEIVCVSAIIVLNPMARDLSEEAAEKVYQLRNRVYTTLYQIIKECRPSCNPNTTFGNLLLYLPIISSLANAMSENLRFAQTFSALGGIPLLTSLFGCFPVEPFVESEMALVAKMAMEKRPEEVEEVKEEKKVERRKAEKKRGRRHSEAGTQTDWKSQMQQLTGRKRRLGPAPSLDESNEFRLLKAPCSYTLTEMFDDRINEEEEGVELGQRQQEKATGEWPSRAWSSSQSVQGAPAARLSRTISHQQMQQTSSQDVQQQPGEFRRPSGSWSNPTVRQRQAVQGTGMDQPQPSTANWPQQWIASSSAIVTPATTTTVLYPPTTQIQGLYLGDERGQGGQQSRNDGLRGQPGPILPPPSTTNFCWPNYATAHSAFPMDAQQQHVVPPFHAVQFPQSSVTPSHAQYFYGPPHLPRPQFYDNNNRTL